MDWGKPFSASYRFMRVSRSTGNETQLLSQFESGGSITRNNDTTTKESGKASIVGDLDIGADLVRVYLDATEIEGDGSESVALGTFLPSVSSRDVNAQLATSDVKLYGRLKEVEDADFESPISVASGESPVSKAVEILEGCGLEVDAEESDYKLSSTWTFGTESDENGKLDAVNDLLDVAGFYAATTDPYGKVMLRKYQEPEAVTVAHTFQEGEDARFLSDMTDEKDASDVANVVKCVYSTEDSTVIGIARDEDPDSPYSTVSLGREVYARYDYDDEVTQDEANAKAASLLKESQSVIHRVTLEHILVPSLTVRDAVQIEYPSGGISGKFIIRTQDIDLGAGCLVTAEVKINE